MSPQQPLILPAGVLNSPVSSDGSILAATAACVSGIELYVAADGDDANPGTQERPFGTLEAARDAIRELKEATGFSEGGVTVWIGGGTYRLTKSFRLDSRDSGAAQEPIVYRVRAGQDAILSGCPEVVTSMFEEVNNPTILNRVLTRDIHEKLRQIDLAKLGITRLDPIDPRGFPHPIRPAPIELFIDGKPTTLARWPNEGFVDTGRVIHPDSRPRSGEKPDRRSDSP